MRRLFEIDLHDYEEGDSVFLRPSARGIIFNTDGKIALVYSRKEKYYKFPGGGIRENEDKTDALIREVGEETGLKVIPKSIREYGSVMRRQKSDVMPKTIFEQENFYYICTAEEEIYKQNLDDYEAEADFVLRFVSIDEAISANAEYKSENNFDTIMIARERRVLEIIKSELQDYEK